MYRMVDCGTWDDPWFAELEPNAKLLFLYLLTNHRSTPAGCFEIGIRQMAFETGIAADCVSALLSGFGDRVTWWPDVQVVWVKNFYRRQMGERDNPKFREGARRVLAKFPVVVRETVCKEYPDLRASNDTPVEGYTRGSHTPMPSSPVPVPVEEPVNEEEPTARSEIAAADDRSDGLVYALVDAFATGKGLKRGDLVGSARQKAFRSLQSAPPWVTPEDVSACTAYLMSDPFWQEPGKLKAQSVVETLPEWRTKGKPKTLGSTRARPMNGRPAAPSTVVSRLDGPKQREAIGR